MVKVYLKGGGVGWYGKSDKYKDHRRQQRRDKKRKDIQARREAEFDGYHSADLLEDAYSDFYANNPGYVSAANPYGYGFDPEDPEHEGFYDDWIEGEWAGSNYIDPDWPEEPEEDDYYDPHPYEYWY